MKGWRRCRNCGQPFPANDLYIRAKVCEACLVENERWGRRPFDNAEFRAAHQKLLSAEARCVNRGRGEGENG